ncbi:hypothetical protein [Diaphorobacter aerolatus]|uniref:Uncharacterized protein n=1 Tax=Diaphorobacter aerolatus TaxID=1288495 RepID=A0A7H0GLH2_9BURK|nr:hypothetical protein [Diaphorobacter aerolatus]QNP49138.1 hypothetical protein H9K75_03085 [Diaphorobacter aerolatus]
MRAIFTRRALLCLSLVVTVCQSAPAVAAAFTPGNVVVLRVGNGAGALVTTGNPAFLDEFQPNGNLVQSIAMPTSANGAQQPFASSGTALTDGWMTRSQDKRCLVVPGYGRDPAVTNSGNLVSAAGVPRVVALFRETARWTPRPH